MKYFITIFLAICSGAGLMICIRDYQQQAHLRDAFLVGLHIASLMVCHAKLVRSKDPLPYE